MKILLLSHNKEIETFAKLAASTKGHSTVSYSAKAYDSNEFAKHLDEHLPNRVLMDINYGFPGKEVSTPFLDAAKLMRQRGYRLESSLLGITGHEPFAQEIETEHTLRVAVKGKGTLDIIKFMQE
ncbi:MAG: hypothetical protein AABX66_02915 [Nanoarchaeota archaeon]